MKLLKGIPRRSALEWAEFKGNWDAYNCLKNHGYTLDEVKEGLPLFLGSVRQQVLWVAMKINIPAIIFVMKNEQYFAACKLLMVHLQILHFRYQDKIESEINAKWNSLQNIYNQKEIVMFLLTMLFDNHTELNFDIHAADKNMDTLLHIAAKYKNDEMYLYLGKLGINDQRKNRWGFIAPQIKKHSDKKNCDEMSLAITKQDINKLSSLLEQGVSTELYMRAPSYSANAPALDVPHINVDGSALIDLALVC